MANKKKPKPRKVTPLGPSKAEREQSAARVTKVIQNMLKPPETVLSHLTRVGAEFWVAPMGVDSEGKHYARPCLVVPYDDLISKELAHISSGPDGYSAEDKAASSASARDVLAEMGVPGMPVGKQNGKASHLASLTDFRDRIKQTRDSLEKVQGLKKEEPLREDGAIDDDEYPIIGECPS